MKKILIILLAGLSVLCVFTSCENGGSNAAAEAKTKTAYHTVTFKTGIETTVPVQTITDGSKATAPDTSSFFKEGFEFGGWTLDGDLYDFNSPVTKDIVLVAKWGVKCTVVFYDSDGDTTLGIEPQVIDFYSKATEPETPKKAGYTFIRWVDRDRAPYNFARPVYDTSLDLIAVWEANEYTVTYDANGSGDSSLLPTATYTYGDSITMPGLPSSTRFSKVGCIFTGWSLNADGSGDVYKPGETVKGQPNNMTLYAVWTDPGYQEYSTGPAGGLIIAVNTDTSAAATWKYIEVASEPISGSFCYGYKREVNATNQVVGATGEGLGDGKTNTEKLVEAMGDTAPIEETSKLGQVPGVSGSVAEYYDVKDVYAAKACMDYTLVKDDTTYDDWYLPSKGELLNIYLRRVETGLYATSTEVDKDNCLMVLFVNQVINGIKIPTQGTSETRARNESVWVLPIRYI